MIVLRLPYPPSVNNYWIASGHRRFISKRGREFKDAVWIYMLEHKIKKLGAEPVQIYIKLHPRSKVLMDIDNCSKAILDSIQDAGIINDDKQVQKLTIERGPMIKNGGCLVTIEIYKTPPSSDGELVDLQPAVS